jgi:hypothetical protein
MQFGPKPIEDPAPSPAGWVVEVVTPLLGLNIERRSLFAVGTADEGFAQELVRKAIGSLHGAVQAKLILSQRALADMDVGHEQVKMLHGPNGN